MHAVFLGGVVGVTAGLPPSVEAGAPMNVRLVEPEAREEPEAHEAPVAEADTLPPVPTPVVTAPRRGRVPSADARAAGPADPSLPPPVVVTASAPEAAASGAVREDTASTPASAPMPPLAAASEPASAPNAASAPAAAASATFLADGETPPPTYRTVLPPSATMRYEVRRGFLRGTGEIRWERSGDDYALRLEARIAGLTLLTQTSDGTVGSDGIAPTRFVDQRARRAAQAANFDRGKGTVGFSGPATVWPLLAGAQDQLSWMMQLAGIVAAEPERATEGGRITMVIVGARGDAAVRTLRFVGLENAETSAGSVPALKFVVDRRATYDTSYEIWLDPARHYLPAHATQRNAAGESQFDLLLERIDLPP